MIRYFNRSTKSEYMVGAYYCIYGEESELLVWPWGFFAETGRSLHLLMKYERELDEIPDPEPIEREYLNATDNPYKDGFKYPDAGLEASHGA